MQLQKLSIRQVEISINLTIKDPSPIKVNLGRGVYKDDNGKDWPLPSVIKAEAAVAKSNPEITEIPFDGLKDFTKVAADYLFGADSELIKERRVIYDATH